MQRNQIAPEVTAFTHDGRSSCSMIHTKDGIILIDTTARPVDIQECLKLENAKSENVCLILLTHSHSDHTSGVPLFDCPVLAHKLTKQRIRRRNSERSKRQMPTAVFEDRKEIQIGELALEFIHVGGHTPGSSLVWYPKQRILFAGDLIFEGRYPFFASARLKTLMDALRFLISFEAEIIVPGHGSLCNNDEVMRQLKYIEEIWMLTENHVRKGDSLEETLKDLKYPVYSERGYEKLHPWNIRVAYQQLSKLLNE